MKTCHKCGKEKDISDFYIHPKMADGHLNNCKQCVKERVSLHREKNIERIRAYDRIRGFHSGTLTLAISKKEWSVRNPEKRKAHLDVEFAIKSGILTKPSSCEICELKRKLYAHHTDYSEPLLVIWLCDKCHKDVHRKSNIAYYEYKKQKVI